jgi:molybdate transport system ATP-binding protein
MLSIDIHKALHGSQGQMRLEVKLDIKQGEFVVLMGESGSGKTTLLRILAGLEKAEGSIVVEGATWDNLAPQKRQIGFVFQDYALFENMSVEENLLFVKDDKSLAKKLLTLTELTGLASRNVKSLSGGQKQRVSLCRAMMNKPRLLLMDEPLSALDVKMKETLQDEIVKLHNAFGTTTIMVSHDAESSYALADRIIVLELGKVIKNGSKDEVLQKSTRVTYSLVD